MRVTIEHESFEILVRQLSSLLFDIRNDLKHFKADHPDEKLRLTNDLAKELKKMEKTEALLDELAADIPKHIQLREYGTMQGHFSKCSWVLVYGEDGKTEYYQEEDFDGSEASWVLSSSFQSSAVLLIFIGHYVHPGAPSFWKKCQSYAFQKVFR
ncbi:hypothetical protein BC832DRAFT_543065 [Gaertneriomyces semiglobifer]|nr:hypothetical protein BC832DRAFT_543065 [Gaertneriomyces semiglobifer]